MISIEQVKTYNDLMQLLIQLNEPITIWCGHFDEHISNTSLGNVEFKQAKDNDYTHLKDGFPYFELS